MIINPKSLTRARKNRGLTRGQAAEALGLEPKTIAAWEQGDKQPRPAQLVNLAGLYGCHIDDFREEGSEEAPLPLTHLKLTCVSTMLNGAAATLDAGLRDDGLDDIQAVRQAYEMVKKALPALERCANLTYLQAALALDPAAYDIETPARIQGCPDFYFPGAPRNPGGCGTLDGNCVVCWNRQYQGEAPRAGKHSSED